MRALLPNLRPTPFGLSFLILILLTLIGCINYGLSLGYGLTFLLGGVWVMTAAQATRAARHLHVRLSPPPELVAGQQGTFTIHARNAGPAALLGVRLGTSQGDLRRGVLAVPAAQSAALHLPVPAHVRGALTVTYLRLYALDLLGLWEVILLANPPAAPLTVEVLPAPTPGAPNPPQRFMPGHSEGTARTRGDEEFAGVRPYQPGDSPRQVSWRHVARTGTLLTREHDAAQGRARLLDWADTAQAGEHERRVSLLAAWITQAGQAGMPFAVALPGLTPQAGQGEGHARSALHALARLEPLPTPPASGTTPRAAPLDQAALLFTLLALLFTLLPGVPRQPWWNTLLTFGVLGYTAARTRPAAQAWPAPPIWLLGLLAGLGAALLVGQYGTLLGRDAGTALLSLLLALKVAESRTRRDGHLLVLLGLFVNSTHYFFSQGPLAALHTVLAAVALLGAAARWATVNPASATTDPRPTPAPADTLLRAGQLLMLAVPLSLTLFILFPRPDRPLWQLPMQGQATTGLGNEIRAGDFSNLAQSSAVAFRADFQGARPPAGNLYWRGPVYEAYDGETWRQEFRRYPPPSVERTGPRWTYTLTLEPSNNPWLLALDTPRTVPEDAIITSAFQAATFRPVSTRRRVTLESQAALLGRQESTARLERNLLIPAGQNPRALTLARTWADLPPAQRVQSALNFLAQGGFTYTLSPPTLPTQNRIDAFLFTSKQGFCEHYASAFAYLMRAAGLPTRLVAGYLGGQINPDGGYLIVRQQDAHAWTEVWLSGQGWVRVDPTAVIAPARLNVGVQTALNRPQATTAPTPTLWGRAQLRLDALQNRWNDLIVGYDGTQQQALLERAGLGRVGSPTYLLLLPLLLALTLLPALLLLRQRARPTDPATRAWHDLTLKLGVPRAPGETISTYAQRIKTQRPHLSAPLDDLVRAYQAARYAPEGQAEALQTLKAALKKIRG